MKQLTKILVLSLAVISLTSCYKGWWERIEILEQQVTDHESRIQALENLCKRLNTNVANLQVLIQTYERGESITAIQEFDNDGAGRSGCVIVFASGKIITIYNGKDGAVPQISAREEGGVWYWTINGEWLYDENGYKVRASGYESSPSYIVRHISQPNADSQLQLANGRWSVNNNGEWSEIGAAMLQALPQLRLENNYWYVSFDNISWNKLALAENAVALNTANALTLQADGRWFADNQELGHAVSADGNVCVLTEISFDLVNGYLFADYGFGYSPIPCGRIAPTIDTQSAAIPQLDVDAEGNWFISCNNGQTWEAVTTTESNSWTNIDTTNPNYVTLTLEDGKTISIPRANTAATRIPVEQVVINDNNLTLHIGEEYDMTATVFPLNATFPGVIWKSTNTNIATINYLTGHAVALVAGETVVSASADGQNCAYQIKITVVE